MGGTTTAEKGKKKKNLDAATASASVTASVTTPGVEATPNVTPATVATEAPSMMPTAAPAISETPLAMFSNPPTNTVFKPGIEN